MIEGGAPGTQCVLRTIECHLVGPWLTLAHLTAVRAENPIHGRHPWFQGRWPACEDFGSWVYASST